MRALRALVRNLAAQNPLTQRAWHWMVRAYYAMQFKLVSDKTQGIRSFRRRIGANPDLANPVGFNEKILWLKLHNRHPLMTVCTDKVLVRDYVRGQGLEGILNRVYGVYDSADDIDFSSLPSKAFIKTNHGSGTNIKWDATRPFDQAAFRNQFNLALKSNYYHQSREWSYKYIEPKIIVEEVLEHHDPLVDYRFLCFDGEVKALFVDIETAAADGSHNPGARRNVYDPDFNLLSVKVGRDNFPPSQVSRPPNFCQMRAVAETLSAPFAFCRVDLYNLDGRIVFGEITFYPGSGGQKVTPESADKKFGSWIDLDSDRIFRE